MPMPSSKNGTVHSSVREHKGGQCSAKGSSGTWPQLIRFSKRPSPVVVWPDISTGASATHTYTLDGGDNVEAVWQCPGQAAAGFLARHALKRQIEAVRDAASRLAWTAGGTAGGSVRHCLCDSLVKPAVLGRMGLKQEATQRG